MSAWAWRDCDCGKRVHYGFYCSSCGRDPWRIEADTLRTLKELEGKKDNLKRQIEDIDSCIALEKRKLPRTVEKGKA